MRSKSERRALHTTPQKMLKGKKLNRSSSSRIIQSNGKIYNETVVDGKSFFSEVKTRKV